MLHSVHDNSSRKNIKLIIIKLILYHFWCHESKHPTNLNLLIKINIPYLLDKAYEYDLRESIFIKKIYRFFNISRGGNYDFQKNN